MHLVLPGPALSRLCSGVGDPQVRCRQEMVKMRHVAEIPDIGFAAPVGLPPGLEVMTTLRFNSYGRACRARASSVPFLTREAAAERACGRGGRLTSSTHERRSR